MNPAEKIRIAKEAREIGVLLRADPEKGCPCPCHRGQKGIFHILPCHPDPSMVPVVYR